MTPPTDLRGGGVPAPAGPAVLDNAVRGALDGPHAHLAERVGRAARHRPDTCAFAAPAAPADPADPAARADPHRLADRQGRRRGRRP